MFVAPDLKIVEVHWISRTCLIGHVDSLQAELDKYSGILRKELSNLRVLGEVPPIKFIPGIKSLVQFPLISNTIVIILDKVLSHGAVLDQLLVNAEMSEEQEDLNEEVDLPPMKNDVFGLDRQLIITKVSF